MAETDARVIHASAEEGVVLRNPLGGPMTLRARGHETGGALTALESTAAPGEGPPLHAHANEDELIYFLDGHFRVKLAGTVRDAPSGLLTFIPKGIPHTWQNVGDAPARLLAIFTPAAPGMETFFERFAKLGDDGGPDAFRTLGREAGMEVLGPPLAQSDPLP